MFINCPRFEDRAGLVERRDGQSRSSSIYPADRNGAPSVRSFVGITGDHSVQRQWAKYGFSKRFLGQETELPAENYVFPLSSHTLFTI